MYSANGNIRLLLNGLICCHAIAKQMKLNNENLLGAMIFEADGSVPGAVESESK